MGKDAARQTADTAGHDGPITSGSSNVLTGGFPAARMGDTFVCIAHASSKLSDEDGDGQYDTSDVKAEIADFQLNHPIGDSGANLNLGVAVGKAEMTAAIIANEDVHSSPVDAKAEGVSGNISLSSGKTAAGDSVEASAEGTAGLAEAKGNYSITHDIDEAEVGAAFELGAEAAVAKGQLSGAIDSKYFKLKGSVDGTVGASIGLGGGHGWILIISW
ncbi:hypothetical protein CNQ08_004764 [Salmonella enterica]|nr:hypothetical protein [Salmonella enterica]EDQ0630385.1 hypothetical protein [Salmonella enterica]EDR7170478.1 hypothetical protein [Salmonella enterica subsp. houtenae]EJU5353237.1 PAAR domain-containing protein [Salmonella enterica]